jgi:low affinity Fe/Cu permease
MVFLIQYTQNRDSAAEGAHNARLDLEKLSANDLEGIRVLYEKQAEQRGWRDIGTREATSA